MYLYLAGAEGQLRKLWCVRGGPWLSCLSSPRIPGSVCSGGFWILAKVQAYFYPAVPTQEPTHNTQQRSTHNVSQDLRRQINLASVQWPVGSFHLSLLFLNISILPGISVFTSRDVTTWEVHHRVMLDCVIDNPKFRPFLDELTVLMIRLKSRIEAVWQFLGM